MVFHTKVFLVLILFLIGMYVERSSELGSVIFEENNTKQRNPIHSTAAQQANLNESQSIESHLSQVNNQLTLEKNKFNNFPNKYRTLISWQLNPA